MRNYQYLYIPVSYLEKLHISKESFMQDSKEAKRFLFDIFNSLPSYIELKNTFLIKSSFVLILGHKQNISFSNSENFYMFCDFIKNTNFYNLISIDENKKEISVDKDIPPIFYNLLYEFLV